jgi:uncharacterized protein (TIGR02246 family)
MDADEAAIRQLVSTWHAASRAGDVDTVLSLMSDDVLFLVPGREPMRKQEFAALSRPQPGQPMPEVSGTSEILEITLAGEWAFMVTRLAVRMRPPDGSPALERAGHTLTVLHKVDCRWVIARDANLLAPVPPSAETPADVV